MKKSLITFTIMLTAVAMVAAFSGPAQAAVTGVCSECHTMHNSQGGSPMRVDDVVAPLSALLLNDCLGCHTTDSTDPFVDGYPFVQLASGAGDSNCLAGGFFPTTMGSGDNNDNHHGIGNTNDPAGKETGSFYTQGTTGLGCAGINGCHGNETDLDDMAAISGGHHDPSAYRILYVGTDAVLGSGAKDYEEAIIADTAGTQTVYTSGADQNVNIYSAEVTDPSISELCAKCHGDFHNENGSTADCGSGSPWIRHPTDVAIPTTWTIGGSTYTLDAADYKHNPVGYDDAIFQATAGRKATCLSCHRAHGTAHNDLLRWAYSTQDAGSELEYGCLGCHDRQR